MVLHDRHAVRVSQVQDIGAFEFRIWMGQAVALLIDDEDVITIFEAKTADCVACSPLRGGQREAPGGGLLLEH